MPDVLRLCAVGDMLAPIKRHIGPFVEPFVRHTYYKTANIQRTPCGLCA